MKIEKYNMKKEVQKAFYIFPIMTYGYGLKGKALCFGWLWHIWILWISKKDTTKDEL